MQYAIVKNLVTLKKIWFDLILFVSFLRTGIDVLQSVDVK
jgi:hypothetical protein